MARLTKKEKEALDNLREAIINFRSNPTSFSPESLYYIERLFNDLLDPNTFKD